MRTTVEMPDELLRRAKAQAALEGISLRVFLIQAAEQRLAAGVKSRKSPPLFHAGGRVASVTAGQRDAAMFAK